MSNVDQLTRSARVGVRAVQAAPVKPTTKPRHPQGPGRRPDESRGPAVGVQLSGHALHRAHGCAVGESSAPQAFVEAITRPQPGGQLTRRGLALIMGVMGVIVAVATLVVVTQFFAVSNAPIEASIPVAAGG